MPRIYLSPPHLGSEELELVRDAFASNWIAPLGPHVDAFERELAERVAAGHAAAVSSGTAALHLALRLLDVGPGDEVFCPTLTFTATANPIVYQGAVPAFLDVDPGTWTLDAGLLDEELRRAAARGKLPKAVISVDLYGQSADYDALLEACRRYDVPLVEDAAEALGATYKDRPVGGLGRLGVFSFNGNKILTTSGGGMLVSDDGALVERARFLASQARDPAPHYEHSEVGYNYRLSNVLAAIGRGQLRRLPERVEARRRNFDAYREALGAVAGLRFMPEAAYGRATRWLTVVLIDAAGFGASREQARLALEAQDIEARPAWKPLHLQPAFRDARVAGGGVAEALFRDGLCLPSGSALAPPDRDRVVSTMLGARGRP